MFSMILQTIVSCSVPMASRERSGDETEAGTSFKYLELFHKFCMPVKHCTIGTFTADLEKRRQVFKMRRYTRILNIFVQGPCYQQRSSQ